ncbi:MAG: hypothetical protein ACRD2I_23580 [Vicinamibacterales bacterium]
MTRALLLALAIGLVPIAASAQTGPAALDLNTAEQASQGPMTVEQVHEGGFLVAPDFKFTEIDHRTSGLVGGYAGLVFAEHLFVGGGGYVLATDRHGRDLAYGGVILQWFGGSDTFGFGAKTLLGGGHTEWSGVAQLLDQRGRVIRSEPFRTSQGLYVAEPELDARIRIAPHLRLAVGAGYRFTGYDRTDIHLDVPGRVRLSGATASIGLQIGGGS